MVTSRISVYEYNKFSTIFVLTWIVVQLGGTLQHPEFSWKTDVPPLLRVYSTVLLMCYTVSTSKPSHATAGSGVASEKAFSSSGHCLSCSYRSREQQWLTVNFPSLNNVFTAHLIDYLKITNSVLMCYFGFLVTFK